jgi:hypothetical protein
MRLGGAKNTSVRRTYTPGNRILYQTGGDDMTEFSEYRREEIAALAGEIKSMEAELAEESDTNDVG